MSVVVGDEAARCGGGWDNSVMQVFKAFGAAAILSVTLLSPAYGQLRSAPGLTLQRQGNVIQFSQLPFDHFAA